MAEPTILIVDDHQLAREGLRAVLAGDGFDVVGLASTGEEALELVAELMALRPPSELRRCNCLPK